MGKGEKERRKKEEEEVVVSVGRRRRKKQKERKNKRRGKAEKKTKLFSFIFFSFAYLEVWVQDELEPGEHPRGRAGRLCCGGRGRRLRFCCCCCCCSSLSCLSSFCFRQRRGGGGGSGGGRSSSRSGRSFAYFFLRCCCRRCGSPRLRVGEEALRCFFCFFVCEREANETEFFFPSKGNEKQRETKKSKKLFFHPEHHHSLPQSLRSPEALICHSCGAGGLLPPGGKGCPGTQPNGGAREVKPSLRASGPATAATAAAEGGGGGGRELAPPSGTRRLGCLLGGAGEASRRSWRREQEACDVLRGKRRGVERERKKVGGSGEKVECNKGGLAKEKKKKKTIIKAFPLPRPLASTRPGPSRALRGRLPPSVLLLLLLLPPCAVPARGRAGASRGRRRRRRLRGELSRPTRSLPTTASRLF